MKTVTILIFYFSILCTGPLAYAQIKVGTTLALSGPAQNIGKNMVIGIETYFAAVNAAGGVAGQKLELVKRDDGYVPLVAAQNMNELIDKENVIAVLGNVGTPTAEVTVPIANAKKTLMFGAFSGANLLRKQPPDRYVINFRASYADETAAMIAGLAKAGIRPHEIAFFTQHDGYGDAGYEGAVQALMAAGYHEARQLPHGRYKRNTLDIEEALLTLLSAPTPPRAIIMVGAYAPSAKFIRIARRVLPQTLFLNLSFVNGEALAEALGDAGDGVIVTQVVPLCPSKTPICSQYFEDLTTYAPEVKPSFVSLEGYIIARLLVTGLRDAGDAPSRETLVTAMESIRDYDVGIGAPISYSSASHNGNHSVWATVIDRGHFYPLRWRALAQSR